MRWSGLFSPNTLTASSSLCSFITTLNFPPLGMPSDIHRVRVALFERRSMIRMNSRASKLMVSFPFLKLSSSSRTVIGIATSLSSKLRIALWLYRMTEVSSTNIFFVLSFFFTIRRGFSVSKSKARMTGWCTNGWEDINMLLLRGGSVWNSSQEVVRHFRQDKEDTLSGCPLRHTKTTNKSMGEYILGIPVSRFGFEPVVISLSARFHPGSKLQVCRGDLALFDGIVKTG